jgi:integrase
MRTRLKGVHKVTSKGRTYYYHRPTKTRIVARYGTIDFDREVTALNARTARRDDRPGTLGGLITAYRASPEYAAKKPRTRALDETILAWLAPIADMPLHQVTPPFVIGLRDRMLAAHKRVKANQLLNLIGAIWRWGLPRDITKGAIPTTGVPKIARPKGMKIRNRRWTMDEIRFFVERVPSLRLAVLVAAYTALRESDVAALAWSAYDGERLLVQQGKTGDMVWMPVHPALKAILDELPREHEQIVTGPFGKPFKSGQAIAWLFNTSKRRIAEIPKDLTFHGLRHTVASGIADRGGDTRDIMSVTGHRTEAMASKYAEQADRQRRAKKAIDLMDKV